jgi:predicted O-methyltransferase YrrM
VIEWKSPTNLVVDEVGFVLAATDTQGGRRQADEAGALLLRKAPWMVDRYLALRSEISPANVVELGIYDGGSTAFLSLLFAPRRLVAVELQPAPVEALERFIAERGLGTSVKPYYGVDQSDTDRLAEIVTAEFGAEPLDLVIDDASHLLEPTSASFNALFPRLRPGGLFVIEDWSWQHFNDEALVKALGATDARRAEVSRRLESDDLPVDHPLSRLVLQILLTAAYDASVVSEVLNARKSWVVVQRGHAELDPKTFDIGERVGAVGRTLLA